MSNINLSVAIMTHPKRTKQLKNLIAQIGDQIEYTVIKDKTGVWNSSIQAWRAYTPEATHHMVLHDDVILSQNFFSIARKLISTVYAGDSISFCDKLTSEMNLAEREGFHWVVTTKVRQGQCLVQPVSQIEDFIHFSEWFVRPDYDYDYGRLEIFLKKHRRAIWHSVPSLVEHDDHGAVGSKDDESEPRLGFKFIGKDSQADQKMWTSLRVGFKPSPLRVVEQWGVGDISMLNVGAYPEYKTLSNPTVSVPYEEIMQEARISRNVSSPYIIPNTGRSAALANPCKEGDPCD